MQVDLKYHPDAFASLEQAFDPVTNTNYAAQFLLGLYHGEAGGSWDVAVGLYHSHTAWLAAAYRDRVAMIGSDIQRGTLTDVPLYVRAIRRGTLRLPLTGGRVTMIDVRRQPALGHSTLHGVPDREDTRPLPQWWPTSVRMRGNSPCADKPHANRTRT